MKINVIMNMNMKMKMKIVNFENSILFSTHMKIEKGTKSNNKLIHRITYKQRKGTEHDKKDK